MESKQQEIDFLRIVVLSQFLSPFLLLLSYFSSFFIFRETLTIHTCVFKILLA